MTADNNSWDAKGGSVSQLDSSGDALIEFAPLDQENGEAAGVSHEIIARDL
jgi:hypothetical protein